MHYVNCTNEECRLTLRIEPTEDDTSFHLIGPASEWYPDKYPCPRCESVCVMSNSRGGGRDVHDLTSQEAYVAFLGVGLPKERECSAAAVREHLLSSPVKRAETEHIQGTSRCVLKLLELEDGTRLHLGASSHGATVYRISNTKDRYAEST